MNKIFNLFLINTILFLLLITMSSCSSLRESAGVTRKSPDEYKIVKNPPLELPPDYNLLPSEEILAKKKTKNNSDLAKEIVFGLGEEENPSQNNLSSSALDSILDQSGANQASKNIREEIVVINEELLSSTKGVFSGEKYLSEEEILDAVKESQRIRENIFNDKSLLEGETPITTRPKKRNSLFGKLF